MSSVLESSRCLLFGRGPKEDVTDSFNWSRVKNKCIFEHIRVVVLWFFFWSSFLFIIEVSAFLRAPSRKISGLYGCRAVHPSVPRRREIVLISIRLYNYGSNVFRDHFTKPHSCVEQMYLRIPECHGSLIFNIHSRDAACALRRCLRDVIVHQCGGSRCYNYLNSYLSWCGRPLICPLIYLMGQCLQMGQFHCDTSLMFLICKTYYPPLSRLPFFQVAALNKCLIYDFPI